MAHGCQIKLVAHELALEVVRGALGGRGNMQTLGMTVLQVALGSHIAPVVDDAIVKLIQPRLIREPPRGHGICVVLNCLWMSYGEKKANFGMRLKLGSSM